MSATGVNDQGIVVGEYEGTCTPDCGGISQAWMYQQSSGALTELTFDPTETGASANGISDGGIISGQEIRSDGQLAGYWTVTGGAVVLSGEWQGSDWAVAANDAGTVVGDFGTWGTPGEGALTWAPSAYAETSLPGLRCDYCPRGDVLVNAINDGGTAVGHSAYDLGPDDAPAGVLAVEWQSGAVTSVGSLQNSGYSDAYGINSGGDIVGASRVGSAAGAPTHAFLIHDGAMTDLGTLPGDTNSSAIAVNDAGQIVGSSDDGDTARAFLYEGGRMFDLNSLIDPTSPLAGEVTLKNAAGISSNGLIAVNGTDSRDTGANAGTTRAFLLIPRVPATD